MKYIYNKCLESGIHLVHLKYTEMKPLLKNVDRNNMFNYRPIALPNQQMPHHSVAEVQQTDHYSIVPSKQPAIIQTVSTVCVIAIFGTHS